MSIFKKIILILNFTFIVGLFCGNLVFSDSNGVWHETKDIRGGVFGSDEQDVTSFYSFINRVSFNNEVFIYNNSLSITKNEGSLNLIGINHTYIQFYPNSEVAGRKAWIGFGDANDDNLTISSENSVILNSISGGYYLGYISDATRIAKVPPLCIGQGAALQWDGNSWSCFISPVNGICGTSSGVCNAGTKISDNGQISCGTTRSWTCQGLNGGVSSGTCNYINSPCPINGACSASSGVCTSGIVIGDNGQTSCGTTRSWTCQGQYGGSNSGTCSYTNVPCPINGACSTSSGVCTAGTVITDNGLNSCGTTRSWTCQGQYGGSNSDTCSYTNVQCPINGVCGAASGTCSTGTIIGDNGQTSCDTTRSWTCQGQYGGSNSLTCNFNNPSCAAPSFSRKIIFTSDTYWVVPTDNSGVIRAKVWGAGGGRGTIYTTLGGGGGFAKGDILISPGTTLVVKVGSAGISSSYGGSGGGLSGVFISSITQANALIVAGSGGGGAYAWAGYCNGAAGGGLTGSSGTRFYSYPNWVGGTGGTQTSGGVNTAKGGAYDGGALYGGSRDSYSGGGGAGYFGGGAGNSDAGSDYASGGGGSSYVKAGSTNVQHIGGSGNAVANSADADYVTGKGNELEPGYVVIYY